MTQVEKLIKIIMPDLLRYLRMKESGELAQKRLDNLSNPSMYCVDNEERLNNDGDQECK